jgi:N-acetylmuramoyl-L-alanine amidase
MHVQSAPFGSPRIWLVRIVMKATLVLAFLFTAFLLTDAHARRTGPARTQAIDMIVIHSTGGPTCDATTGKPIWVSAGTMDENMRNIEAHPRLGIHYMIDRDGAVRTSVPEDQIAHHVMTFSQRSIAIELINDGDGRDPFPAPQLDALVKLLQDIVQRRGITRDGVIVHSVERWIRGLRSRLRQRLIGCLPSSPRLLDARRATRLAKIQFQRKS